MGVGVEELPGLLSYFLFDLGGYFEGGSSAAVYAAGCVGAYVVDCCACVGAYDVDFVVGYLQLLCYYLGVGVHGASAVVHECGDVVEGAVLVELEHGAAEVDDGAGDGGSGAACVVPSAHPPASAVSAGLRLRSRPVVPVRHLGALGEYLFDAAALDHRLHRRALAPEEVSFADVVHEPEVQGVDAHLLGELVHEGLDGPGDLGVPVAAEGAGGHLVGVHRLPHVALGWELVEADPPADDAAQQRVGLDLVAADVEPRVEVPRRQLPLPVRA